MKKSDHKRYLGFMVGFTILFLFFFGVTSTRVYLLVHYRYHGVKTMGVIVDKETLEYKSYLYSVSYSSNNASYTQRLHSDMDFGNPSDSIEIYYLKTAESKIIFARDLAWNFSIVGFILFTLVLGFIVIYGLMNPDAVNNHLHGDIGW